MPFDTGISLKAKPIMNSPIDRIFELIVTVAFIYRATTCTRRSVVASTLLWRVGPCSRLNSSLDGAHLRALI